MILFTVFWPLCNVIRSFMLVVVSVLYLPLHFIIIVNIIVIITVTFIANIMFIILLSLEILSGAVYYSYEVS